MQATDSFIESNTVKESPNRFRCKLPPNKLFKSEKFVRKHIRSKQKKALAQVVDKVRKECVLGGGLQICYLMPDPEMRNVDNGLLDRYLTSKTVS